MRHTKFKVLYSLFYFFVARSIEGEGKLPKKPCL